MQRYSGVAMGLHWVMGLIMIGLLAVGLWMVDLPLAPFKFEVYQWHKSFGLLVLLLLVVRVGWRWTHPAPMLPVGTPRWQVKVAEFTHFLLYFLMLLMPLSGWLMSDAAGYRPHFFGLAVPLLWAQDSVVAGWAKWVHEMAGKALIGLLILHVGAAVHHHLIVRDGILLRMVPKGLRLPQPKLFGLVLAGILPFGAVQAVEWQVVPEGSKLEWEARYSGSQIIGNFGVWQAEIRLNPDDLADAKVRVVVEVASVGSGDENRDKTLKGIDFFDAVGHPKAVFESSKVSKTSAGFVAAGTLTLAGVSKPLALPFTLQIQGDGAQRLALAQGQVSLSRNAFGVGKGEWQGNATIADLVVVKYVVKATLK